MLDSRRGKKAGTMDEGRGAGTEVAQTDNVNAQAAFVTSHGSALVKRQGKVAGASGRWKVESGWHA